MNYTYWTSRLLGLFLRLCGCKLSLGCGRLCLPSRQPTLLSSGNHRLGLQIREEVLSNQFNDPATDEIDDHRGCKAGLELLRFSICFQKKKIRGGTYRSLHLYNLQPTVQFGNEFSRTREGNSACAKKSVEKCGVFPDTFAEWASLNDEII